jgi:hypothetical protein
LKSTIPFVAVALLVSVVRATPPATLVATIDLGTNSTADIDAIKVYWSPTPAAPLPWQLLSVAQGPTTNVVFPFTPQRGYFYVTASNMWGESGPSNVTNVPAPFGQIKMNGLNKQ